VFTELKAVLRCEKRKSRHTGAVVGQLWSCRHCWFRRLGLLRIQCCQKLQAPFAQAIEQPAWPASIVTELRVRLFRHGSIVYSGEQGRVKR
jgi:hypothetical protein